MRGPHNIIRLIRTGATLQRTGALDVILTACDAPFALRIMAKTLAWPFQWLGLKGDPDMPLSGEFELDTHEADVDSVMEEIKAVLAEEAALQERLRAAEEDED